MSAFLFSSVSYYTDQSGGQYLVYTPFHTENATTGTLVWQTVVNSLIMIAVIAVMTVFLVLLYKYRYNCFVYCIKIFLTCGLN